MTDSNIHRAEVTASVQLPLCHHYSRSTVCSLVRYGNTFLCWVEVRKVTLFPTIKAPSVLKKMYCVSPWWRVLLYYCVYIVLLFIHCNLSITTKKTFIYLFFLVRMTPTPKTMTHYTGAYFKANIMWEISVINESC